MTLRKIKVDQGFRSQSRPTFESSKPLSSKETDPAFVREYIFSYKSWIS
jgi:hypothetical protein